MEGFLLLDTHVLAAALLAVFLVGLAKGGLGGALGILGVPILSLVMSPVQAAGIMLPILIVMDWVSLWSWWGEWDRKTLLMLLPGGLVGIAIGWATAAFVSEPAVKLIVGGIALLFALNWFRGKLRKAELPPHEQNRARGAFWGTVAGYTSFVAHAGGPPYQVYALPLQHPPRIYTSTSVLFFAVVNAVKLIPYFALGQIDVTNLKISAALLPVGALATFVGAFVVKRLKAEVFYPIMYAMVVLVALKLLWDGSTELF
ncbi:sulfite exporter TauE/SafE family protein [Pseudoroseicyclus sp. CXY001]|uniref:sulfite exporter TauE/SafE family protein n=1 Tax=Pseudoroseicyclus sp. CXY001 TaxID=3242492 RepID=UPI003570A57F